MKLDQFSNLDRPRTAKFDEIGTAYSGVIVLEPQWVSDPLDLSREMLRVVLQDDNNTYWQLNARTQMPDAVFDAALAAGVDEIEIGGQLEVEFVETRGNTKIYKATYTPPTPPKGSFSK